MNYGKRSTSKKRNALISRTSMLEKRAHVSFIRVLFTALIAVCVMVICLGIGSFRGVIAGAPDVNDVDISSSIATTACCRLTGICSRATGRRLDVGAESCRI